jgi:hypothetical protein
VRWPTPKGHPRAAVVDAAASLLLTVVYFDPGRTVNVVISAVIVFLAVR